MAEMVIPSLEILGRNVFSLATEDVDHMKARIEKAVYKGTSCGAWVSFQDDGVTVGSIVEGVDYGTEAHVLVYPFQEKDFWEALKEVENEADIIWKSTHGCEDCCSNFEYDNAIDPNCETCEGEGIIL